MNIIVERVSNTSTYTCLTRFWATIPTTTHRQSKRWHFSLAVMQGRNKQKKYFGGVIGVHESVVSDHTTLKTHFSFLTFLPKVNKPLVLVFLKTAITQIRLYFHYAPPLYYLPALDWVMCCERGGSHI